jgi:ABC-type multidrug transport system fused ATPase/permease subunit
MSSNPTGAYGYFLRRYLRPYWRLTCVLAFLLLLTIGLQLAGPQILRQFIDTATSRGSVSSLTFVAVLFLAVAVLTQIVAVAEVYAAENLGWLATNRLRADLALHCLRLDPAFHLEHTPGALIERIDGDVTTLGNFFSRFVVYVLGNGLLLAGVLAALFRVEWRVGAAMTTITIIASAVFIPLRSVAAPSWARARQASAELYGFLEERLSGTEDIRSSGAVAYTMRRFFERSRRLLWTQLKSIVTGMSMAWHNILALTAVTASSLGLGAYLYQQGSISIGTVYLIFAYSQMLTRPVELLTRQLEDFQQAAGSIGRVQSLLALRSQIRDGPINTLPDGPLSVEFDHVSFEYQPNEPVLRDVSFCLRPGRVMGILGPTGSGKTTVSRLIFRLYDPSVGAVRLGDVDLRDTAVATVRERVGMVTQDIQLFHATVRDNLTFFDRSIPDERVREVLEDLGLWEWVEDLPQGLDTRLASGAAGLSAGEAQLLAFARVFLEDPGVVVLDEASSRLDPATEHRIESAVDRLLKGRTGIVIAHRLHTIRRADDILVLEGGSVREWGPRTELERDSGSRLSTILRTGLEEALV